MLVSNRYEIFTNYEVMRGLSVQFISLEDEKFINSVDFYLSAHANGFTFLLRSRFLPFSVGRKRWVWHAVGFYFRKSAMLGCFGSLFLSQTLRPNHL